MKMNDKPVASQIVGWSQGLRHGCQTMTSMMMAKLNRSLAHQGESLTVFLQSMLTSTDLLAGLAPLHNFWIGSQIVKSPPPPTQQRLAA